MKEGIQVNKYWEDQKLGCSAVNVTMGGEDFFIMNIYNRKGVSTIKKQIVEQLEENANMKCIIMGDWNAKIGTWGQKLELDATKEDNMRTTKDLVQNEEGKRLITLMEEMGLTILNGNMEGDWEGAITHIGYRSQSVIDYGAANEEAWGVIEEFKIGDCSLSDHFPLETSIKSQALPTENTPEWKWVYRLDNNSMEKYRRDLVNKNRSGVTDWRQIADNMLAATPRIRISLLKREPHWWNEECYLSRVKVKNQRKIGRITNDFTAYRLARKEYKMCILNAKRKMIEKQEAELRRVKTISEGWKYISKHKFGGTIKQVPGREELISHFKELLGASESQFETERQDREYLPISIGEEEFEESLKSLKLRKAGGNHYTCRPQFICSSDRGRPEGEWHHQNLRGLFNRAKRLP